MDQKGIGRGRGRGRGRGKIKPENIGIPLEAGKNMTVTAEQNSSAYIEPGSIWKSFVQNRSAETSRSFTERNISPVQGSSFASAEETESNVALPLKLAKGRGKTRSENNSRNMTATQNSTALFVQSETNVKSNTQLKNKEPNIPFIQRNASPDGASISSTEELDQILAFPAKPNPGKLGRPIQLTANYFEIIMPQRDVFHYDVEIKEIGKPQRTSYINAERSRTIINNILQRYKSSKGIVWAYDGKKNLISKDILSPNGLRIPWKQIVEGKEECYEVIVKPVEKKESGNCAISLRSLNDFYAGRTTIVPLEAITALEIIMRQTPSLRDVPIGRSFFNNLQTTVNLGRGKEIWFGHYQNVQLAQWKPMLNVDITATTFFKSGPIVNFLCEFLEIKKEQLQNVYLQDRQVLQLTKELKGLKVVVTHLKYRRKHKIVKVTRASADKLTFPMQENGRNIEKTVSSYFFEQYRMNLKYPNLPCLQVAPEQKKVFLPMEVCELLEDQHYKKKLDGNQTSSMIRQTARSPEKRFEDIEDIVKRNVTTDSVLEDFGLRISTRPMSLGGRIINPPAIGYQNAENTRPCMPREGVWYMEGKSFFEPARINKWVLVSFVAENYCNRTALENFATNLYNIGTNCGMRMKRREDVKIFNPRLDIKSALKEVKEGHNPDLVVIVISKFSNYAEIKKVADTELSLVTQCVMDNNVKKNAPNLIANICQKINTKMGGTNNTIFDCDYKLIPKIFDIPVIIIGADVTHPAPTEATRISIAAAVGSLNKSASRYHASVRLQENENKYKKSQEIILDLKEMVKELLLAFYDYNRALKPRKIIFYRDGVSNGQFELVQRFEVMKIREACTELNRDYKPPITFIVVQKRHHTRFRPTNLSDGIGKMKNIPPGTTVDQGVVHPINYDFFLCSHFGIQGTSRPAHYTLLWDDNDFSADDIQMLSYYLCHIYARCTRSISIPTPVMYADLLAYRMKLILNNTGDHSSSSGSDSSKYSNLEQLREVLKSISGFDKMFFV